jgi:hypothetical protein
VTFSPNKKKYADENFHSMSSKSSVSPSKFEKFLKIDPEMMANPFIKVRKNNALKNQIKNSQIYSERQANVPPKVSEKVE